jgi:membrane fusion protein, heavy metal efflux system
VRGPARRCIPDLARTSAWALRRRIAVTLFSTCFLLVGSRLIGLCPVADLECSARASEPHGSGHDLAEAPAEHDAHGDREERHGDTGEHADDARPEHEDHADEGEHHDGEDGERRTFTVAEFEGFGVRVGTAGPGLVDAGIELPGEVRPNGDFIAHLAPRFPGIAREVRKRVGDDVRAGEVMAVVEGDNLASFPLRAAFPGTVIDRHVSLGEVVGPDRPAFIVADLSSVWVEIDVYQSALDRVRTGQTVRISENRGRNVAEGVVSYVSPVVDQATRTARARVALANPDGRWRPGGFVTVLLLEPTSAEVVVPRRAVHRVDGERVVFVVAGDQFEARAVTLGPSGRSLVAITKGLAPGERFADEGSFLVKAELAKGAGAGHHH